MLINPTSTIMCNPNINLLNAAAVAPALYYLSTRPDLAARYLPLIAGLTFAYHGYMYYQKTMQ